MIGQHDLLPGPYSDGHPPVAALNIASANVFELNDFFARHMVPLIAVGHF
jgi:hypothetical protein